MIDIMLFPNGNISVVRNGEVVNDSWIDIITKHFNISNEDCNITMPDGDEYYIASGFKPLRKN